MIKNIKEYLVWLFKNEEVPTDVKHPEEELADWVESMHLQNTNDRMTELEMYRQGIEDTIEELVDLKILPKFDDVKEEPPYEYEMFIDDEDVTPFQFNSWIPIATDRIKDLSRVEEYIEKGIIRRIC